MQTITIPSTNNHYNHTIRHVELNQKVKVTVIN